MVPTGVTSLVLWYGVCPKRFENCVVVAGTTMVFSGTRNSLGQDLRDAHTKLEDEKKKSKSWHDKYKDMKNRYGRVDKHLQEEKKRRTEIENHHEQVYSCTRNKLKIVNDVKSCLEAENRVLKSTIDRFIGEM